MRLRSINICIIVMFVLGSFIFLGLPRLKACQKADIRELSMIHKEGVNSKGRGDHEITASDLKSSTDIPYTNASSLSGKVTNVYFLKLTRCGSTTLTNVLARFAWNHDLRVVTKTRTTWKHGQPDVSYFMDSLTPEFVVSQSEKYNMFLDHSHYVAEAIKKILHEPIAYVSIIRNPLKKLLYYLNMEVKDKSITSLLDKINTCIDCNISLSDMKLKRYFWTHKWFGATSKTGLTKYLNQLDEIFSVGITEYYKESMILMRRKFGWSLKDVLYYPLHVHNYTRTEITDRLYKEFCSLMPEECELYEHFNNTFWKMVHHEGESFSKEVKYYKTVLHKLFEFCTPAYSKLDSGKLVTPTTKTTIEGSEWNEPFEITYMDCAQMRLTDKSFRPLFFYKQNRDHGCKEKCNLQIIPQGRCTQICHATKASRTMELYTNATLNPLLD